MFDRVLKLTAAGLALAVTACASAEKKPPPPPVEMDIKPPANQVVAFTIQASPLINPDGQGMPTPVVVRIYLLASQTAFSEANFFQLWEKDEATLGKSSLAHFETTVPPSGVTRIDAKLVEKTALIGVTAGFRDYRSAKWRALVPFTGEKTLKLKIQVTTKAVNVVADE